MGSFDSTKVALGKILEQIVQGEVQLPDFQRGWIWDDEHIRSLLVSIARSFPIGSIMLLETGGEARFQVRPVEGVELPAGASEVSRLILDGQQRLTSLTQVLMLDRPVRTQDDRKRPVQRYYYFNIEKALEGDSSMEDAIVSVDESRMLKTDFGRTIKLDLSTREKEFAAFYFPCRQILNSDEWEEGLTAFNSSLLPRYMEFRRKILNNFRQYQLPVIDLKKDNSKESVCLVFEKVNTGGVALSVFELVTASYAAEGFNLRDDWYGNPARGIRGRRRCLAEKALLRDLQPTDFLQGVSLLHTYERRSKDLQAVSAKREHVLRLPLAAYQQWAEPLTDGFLSACQFLNMQGFRKPEYLPYRTQLVPLAAVMARLGDRWLEPAILDKLARWFWCGVFGELYGGAVETRIALDMQGLMAWIEQPGAPEPTTVRDAGFQESRLDTLRTRMSAAYRGLYVLLQREGCKDFFCKARIVDLDENELGIDIHHIFPRAWCEKHRIPARVYNAIVNKTPISRRANRMIAGKAPSVYLEELRNHQHVQLTQDEQNEILRTHLIEPSSLRRDDFDSFYRERKKKLLKAIEGVMGKRAIATTTEAPADDADDEEDA